jgi:hypothetical protein
MVVAQMPSSAIAMPAMVVFVLLQAITLEEIMPRGSDGWQANGGRLLRTGRRKIPKSRFQNPKKVQSPSLTMALPALDGGFSGRRFEAGAF